jgi:hypothetical protein
MRLEEYMAIAREVKPVLLAGIFMLLVVRGSLSGWATPLMNQRRPTGDSAQRCLEAAKKALGSEAEVLKCGHLTRSGRLETVAAIRLRQFKTLRNSIPVLRLVVLRQNGSRWETMLTADMQNLIRNSIGYIGVDFIDDSEDEDFVGYRVSFSTEGTRGAPRFMIWLKYLDREERDEGVAIGISWNPSVGRFQEYSENYEPMGFHPEKKNPMHLRLHEQKPPAQH